MREDAERYYAGNRGIATLAAGVLLPPAAWMLHLSVSFTVATALCENGGSNAWVLHLLTPAALAVSITAGFLAWGNWRATGEGTNPDEGGTLGRSKFLAIAGLGSSAFFSLSILAAEGASLMLGSCTS